MKKGLRRIRLDALRSVAAFKTCPDEEGIKTTHAMLAPSLKRHSKLALMKKGLRHDDEVGLADIAQDSKLALMKKGLRLPALNPIPKLDTFKTCPDEEGIKTARRALARRFPGFKTCPDEEGIKTQDRPPWFKSKADSKLALMKKGLRRRDTAARAG